MSRFFLMVVTGSGRKLREECQPHLTGARDDARARLLAYNEVDVIEVHHEEFGLMDTIRRAWEVIRTHETLGVQVLSWPFSRLENANAYIASSVNGGGGWVLSVRQWSGK